MVQELPQLVLSVKLQLLIAKQKLSHKWFAGTLIFKLLTAGSHEVRVRASIISSEQEFKNVKTCVWQTLF